MIDDIDARLDGVGERGRVAHVRQDERGVLAQPRQMRGRRRVADDRDVIAAFHESLGQARADEPAPASDYRAENVGRPIPW